MYILGWSHSCCPFLSASIWGEAEGTLQCLVQSVAAGDNSAFLLGASHTIT